MVLFAEAEAKGRGGESATLLIQTACGPRRRRPPAIRASCSVLQAHKHMRSYINKPIDFYDELRVICGDDYARGTGKVSMYRETEAPTVDLEAANNVTIDVDDPGEADIPDLSSPSFTPSATPSSTPSFNPASSDHSVPYSAASKKTRTAGRKRARPTDDRHDEIVESIHGGMKEIAISIKEASQVHEHWTSQLGRAVMKVPGFDEESLTVALDLLLEDERRARAFIVRAPRMQAKMVAQLVGIPVEHEGTTPSGASDLDGHSGS